MELIKNTSKNISTNSVIDSTEDSGKINYLIDSLRPVLIQKP